MAEGQEQVDALSGATITCDGVSTMIATNLAEYAEFLNNVDNVKPCNVSESEPTTCEAPCNVSEANLNTEE
jgi:Na+-transporting NADH:ubiquinone oxidoreductase subunit NqrC